MEIYTGQVLTAQQMQLVLSAKGAQMQAVIGADVWEANDIELCQESNFLVTTEDRTHTLFKFEMIGDSDKYFVMRNVNLQCLDRKVVNDVQEYCYQV